MLALIALLISSYNYYGSNRGYGYHGSWLAWLFWTVWLLWLSCLLLHLLCDGNDDHYGYGESYDIFGYYSFDT